MHHCS